MLSYQNQIRALASLNDAACVKKYRFVQWYHEARDASLTEPVDAAWLVSHRQMSIKHSAGTRILAGSADAICSSASVAASATNVLSLYYASQTPGYLPRLAPSPTIRDAYE
jgi:hypothetical protein